VFIYPEVPIASAILIGMGLIAAGWGGRGKFPSGTQLGGWLIAGALVLGIAGAILFFFPLALLGAALGLVGFVLWIRGLIIARAMPTGAAILIVCGPLAAGIVGLAGVIFDIDLGLLAAAVMVSLFSAGSFWFGTALWRRGTRDAYEVVTSN
jgi:hypothetical protein